MREGRKRGYSGGCRQGQWKSRVGVGEQDGAEKMYVEQREGKGQKRAKSGRSAGSKGSSDSLITCKYSYLNI